MCHSERGDYMEYDTEIEVLYVKWRKDIESVSEFAEIRSAFYAGYYSAINKVINLIEEAQMRTLNESGSVDTPIESEH